MIRLEPQPKFGRPFRIDFSNRGPEWWYQERAAYRRNCSGGMLISWLCPFGGNGEPVLIEGVWYWQKTATPAEATADRH